MKQAVAAGALWFVTIVTVDSMLAALVGTPTGWGPMVGGAVAVGIVTVVGARHRASVQYRTEPMPDKVA